jgi:tryptophanyl-tRNA synthetase
LLSVLVDKYKKERETFQYLMTHQDELEKKLATGEERARKTAREVLNRVRVKLGFL